MEKFIDLKMKGSFDEATLNQINKLSNSNLHRNQKIRIMPDAHMGKGCTIGTTIRLGEKDILNPNLIGVDIGCGMTTFVLGKDVDINLNELDKFIRNNIPYGTNVYSKSDRGRFKNLEMLYLKNLKYKLPLERVELSVGTLGGGNHFIELGKSESGYYYLTVHSGSRNLGHKVCTHYRKIAEDRFEYFFKEKYNRIKEYLKNTPHLIPIEVKKLKEYYNKEKEFCGLLGEDKENYINDMRICLNYAYYNRIHILNRITSFLKVEVIELIDTPHNYISSNNIIRKGAICADKYSKVIIPINMKDGILLCEGKGNEEWNNSAPHGAGRILSRTEAFKTLNLEEVKSSMEGIAGNSVRENTLDEAPGAYKSLDYILENIDEMVEVLEVIKPIYNFKA